MKNLASAPVWLTIDWSGPEVDEDGLGEPQVRLDIGSKWDLEEFCAVKG